MSAWPLGKLKLPGRGRSKKRVGPIAVEGGLKNQEENFGAQRGGGEAESICDASGCG
jgi:hypothetical protein